MPYAEQTGEASPGMLCLFLFSLRVNRTLFFPKWKDLRTALWKHRLAAQQTFSTLWKTVRGKGKDVFHKFFGIGQKLWKTLLPQSTRLLQN